MNEDDLNTLEFTLSADEARALAQPEVYSKLLKSEIYRNAKMVLHKIRRVIDDECRVSKHWINYSATLMIEDFRGVITTQEEFSNAVRCILESVQASLRRAKYEVTNTATNGVTSSRGYITSYNIYMLIAWVPRDVHDLAATKRGSQLN